MNTETQQCIIEGRKRRMVKNVKNVKSQPSQPSQPSQFSPISQISYNGDLKSLSIEFKDGKMWGCTGKLAIQIFKKLTNG